MAVTYFNISDGSVLTDKVEAGEEAVRSGRAIRLTAPDNIESWRLSANLQTSQVIVYGGIEKNEEQAIQQKMEEAKTEALENKKKSDLMLALIEKQEKERKALQDNYNKQT
jgi:hypothetical protein